MDGHRTPIANVGLDERDPCWVLDKLGIPHPDKLLSASADSLGCKEWNMFSYIFTVDSDSVFDAACSYLNLHLSNKNYMLGGDTPKKADSLVYTSLIYTGERWNSMSQSNKYPNLVCFCNLLQPLILPSLCNRDLLNAKAGEVCVRFSLTPSPAFHLEHARVAFWNHLLAERYKGQMIIRFQDSSPIEQGNEFIAKSLEQLDTLGIKYDAVTHNSDYFPQLMAMAERLIRRGKAYVDDTPEEERTQQVIYGIESSCRYHSLEKNMQLWEEMIAGSDVGLKCFLRGKIDMHHENKCLRDPVYYYCSLVPHHRTGTKFNVYPADPFATSFLDATQTITHALRTTQCRHLNALYHRLLEDMELQTVQIHEVEQLNMESTLLDSRQLSWFVDTGKVSGWDDPRLPTLQGLVRRGLQIQALKKFFLIKGMTKKLNLVKWDKLWALNIESIKARGFPIHSAVVQQKSVLLTLENGPSDPLTKIYPWQGEHKRVVTYWKRIWLEAADSSSISVGEEIILLNWKNVVIKDIAVDKDGHVTELKGVLVCNSPSNSRKSILEWIPATDEPIKLSLLEYDHLITKNKLKPREDIREVLNATTVKETFAFGDSNMCNVKHGEILWLPSKGFFRCDIPFVSSSKPIVLIAIPKPSCPS